MIDLREKDFQAIKQLAYAHLVKGTQLHAYGSRVKGTAYASSDLDLMMFTPEGQVNDLIAFRQSLQDSNIPIIVQVFDWRAMPSNFRENFLHCHQHMLTIEA